MFRKLLIVSFTLALISSSLSCGPGPEVSPIPMPQETTPTEPATATPTPAPVYSTDFDLRDMLGFSDGIITADDITAFIQEKVSNSPMLSETDIGSCFIDAGLNNRINPAFLVATAYLEGLFGTGGWAASHPESHNTMGWGIPSPDTSPNDINSAGSWGEMIKRVAERIAHGPYYYEAELYTVDQVRKKYAGEPNSQSIADIMNDLYAFATVMESFTVDEMYEKLFHSDLAYPEQEELWKNYKGKQVEWTGTLRERTIREDRLEALFTPYVVVEFKEEESQTLSQLDKGDVVTYRGMLDSYGTNMVIILLDYGFSIQMVEEMAEDYQKGLTWSETLKNHRFNLSEIMERSDFEFQEIIILKDGVIIS